MQIGGNDYLVNKVAIHIIKSNVVLTAGSKCERQVESSCCSVAIGIEYYMSAGLNLSVNITTWNLINLVGILVAELLEKETVDGPDAEDIVKFGRVRTPEERGETPPPAPPPVPPAR